MLHVPAPVKRRWGFQTKEAYRRSPASDIIAELSSVVGFSEAHLGLIETAIHEAIVNAVVHGNLEFGGASEEFGDGDLKAFEAFYNAIDQRLKRHDLAHRLIEVSAVYDNGALAVSVKDQGRGFAEPCAQTAKRNSGRGLLVIRSVADEVIYDLGGRRVTMVFYP